MRPWMDGLNWQSQLISGEILQALLCLVLDSLSYSHQVHAGILKLKSVDVVFVGFFW